MSSCVPVSLTRKLRCRKDTGYLPGCGYGAKSLAYCPCPYQHIDPTPTHSLTHSLSYPPTHSTHPLTHLLAGLTATSLQKGQWEPGQHQPHTAHKSAACSFLFLDFSTLSFGLGQTEVDSHGFYSLRDSKSHTCHIPHLLCNCTWHSL